MSGAVDKPVPGVDSAAAKRVTALATALKLTTIYAADHSRVVAAIEHLLAAVRTCPGGGAYVLHLRDGVFQGDEVEVVPTTAPLRWLAARWREARVRGVEIDRNCAVADVVAFAALLKTMVRDDTVAPPPATADVRLRVIPMVFRGRHSESAPAAAAAPGSAAPPQLPLPYVRDAAECQQRLQRIDQIAAAIAPDGRQEVDLVATIGNLLPADVAASPELALNVVLRVLESLENDLRAVQDGGRRLVGGHLLQRAIDVARRYFPRAPTPLPIVGKLPSGRPEDARITADLLLLLEEYDELPIDDRPLADMLAASVGVRLDYELLGILLHSLARGHEHPLALARLQQTIASQAVQESQVSGLLGSYLGPQGSGRLTPARRLRLVGMLVEAGMSRLVRESGYLTSELVVRGFPESLQLVATVLDGDLTGVQVTREALAALAPSLAGTAVALPVSSGALAQPVVWRLLLAVDSAESHAVLQAAFATHALAARAELVPWLRTRNLPAPEATVLQVFPNPQSLPSAYVRSLHAACVRRRYDDALRQATGALLRQALTELPLSFGDRIAAVDQLALVPGSETERLLERLARRGRFLHWGESARVLRRRAAEALLRLRGGAR